MDCIDELERDAYNFVIDELVWHLENGRTPLAIRRNYNLQTGVEFQFGQTAPMFLSVDERLLDQHWEEAKMIINQYSELRSINLIDG